MAASNEKRIICKIMEDGDIQPALDRQVTPAWFFNDTHREAFAWIVSHISKYGNVPTKASFNSQIGTSYGLFSISESLDYLLDEQANSLRWQAAKRMLPSVEDELDARDTEAAVKAIESSLAKINSYSPTPSRIVDSMANPRVAERWADYERREAGGGIIGMTTGFPTIDEATLGLQPGHLITVLAQPKVGKTTVCLAMANHIYEEHEKPVLFVSFEMGIREMELRQEAMMAGVNFLHLQQGKLSKYERRKYIDYLDHVKTGFTWPFHFMDASSGSTVSAIRVQIEHLDPGVVILDGIYMMQDEVTGEANTPQSLTNITRGLKRLATQSAIPIVINTQALNWKSKGVRISIDSAGYSSSFAQDSDVVLGLEKIKPPDGATEESVAYSRTLKVLASRNTGLASVELVFDYDEGKIEEV